MNQYPGFVPMVVPQPYMVAMPTAIPMSGAVGPGLPALPQALHPQVAAAHVAGAPVVTSSVVTAPGMASAVRAAQLSQGVGQLTQGMGQLAAAQGMGHLAAQGMGQHLGMAGMPPHPSHHQGPMSLPTAKVVPQGPSMMGADSRKRPWGSEMDKGKGGRFDNRWQSNPEQDVEEPNIDDSICVLDHFNSDLNLCIDPDGFGASVLLDPPGFCFTWAGARATHGVCKGKVYYEVHILEHLPVDFGEDHQELDPHVVRVGWSIDSSSFQLGEEPWSFGYGGTGKFSTNCRFSDYGQRFGAGDVIGAMLDLESRPASISFLKNGTWFGVAIPLHGFPVGSKDMALYPHILLKNCKVKVNFGQMDAWFPPPQGFTYVGQLPVSERVRGMKNPERKADCEMIMIVGLPGVGKTTWGINMQKSHPEKRYNIIGTDTLIDKMRVMGLPRKRNYHGRWEVLIDKATKCLNKLFEMGGRRKRNYILDQTNVYASARRRKMKFFKGFFRIAGVLQPEDHEMERRSRKRTVEDGKVVPESAVMEMKANFSIPEERDILFDRIDFIELPREKVVGLVEQYVKEGQEKRPPREEVFRHDSRFQKNNQNTDYGQQGSRPGQNQTPYGQRAMMGGPPSKSPMMGGPSKSPMGQGIKSEPQWFSEGDGLLGKAPNQMDDVPSKRLKLDQGGMGRGQQQGGALDLLKQQYDEAEQQDSSQWNQSQSGALQPQDFIKEERHWPPQDTAMAVGSGIGVHGTPLSHHLATQAGALVVSHPPGTIPLAGALGTQPPPPPPPVLPGHLAQTAAGHAFVALTPLPPPGPPPAVVAVGGAGALGGTPPGFHAQLQQMDNVGQPAWSQGGIVGQQSSWQQSESRSSNTSTPNQSGPDGSILRREWGQQVTDRQQGGWQGGQQRWQDQMGDSVQKGGQQAWQRDSGSQQQPWQGQEGSHDGSDKGGQQPWQGGSMSQQQYWQGQERSSDRGQKGWQGSDSNTEGGNSWMQNQGAGDGGRSYDEGRDKYGGIGDQRDVSRHGGYDSKMQSYGGDSSGRRFDDFSRPPPDARGGGRSDDFHGGDSRGGRSYGSNSQSFGDGGGNDRWGSHQRGGSSDRWSSSSSHQDRHGPSDSGESRWSGGGRQDGRDQGDRWGSRGQDRFSGGRDHDRGRDMDRGRDRDRGSDRERERDRDRGSERDRDRGGDRDRSGRDRDRDQDRDSYRDSYRDRERDRGSRDRDHDSSEPRQRRRKSKWDNPEDEAGSKTGGDSSFQQPPIKEEMPTSGFGDRDPSSFQGGQQQNQQFFNRPGQYQPQQSEGNDGQNTFPSRGMGFNRPPPTSAASPGGPSPGQAAQVNFPKDRPSDLPSLLDVQFGNRPPPPPAANLDRSNDNPKSGASETSLLGPVPSTPPPRFQGNTGGPNTQSQTSSMPNTSVPPPRDGPPPPPFGGGGSGGNRPPFQPGAGPRFSGPNTPEGNAMSGGQRPGFRMEGPPRPMRPRNPQNFGGPPGSMGQMGGPPPNAPWNQNRFGGGRGMPPRPRFDGPGGGRFPGGPGPMRWPRGPR